LRLLPSPRPLQEGSFLSFPCPLLFRNFLSPREEGGETVPPFVCTILFAFAPPSSADGFRLYNFPSLSPCRHSGSRDALSISFPEPVKPVPTVHPIVLKSLGIQTFFSSPFSSRPNPDDSPISLVPMDVPLAAPRYSAGSGADYIYFTFPFSFPFCCWTFRYYGAWTRCPPFDLSANFLPLSAFSFSPPISLGCFFDHETSEGYGCASRFPF